ncbi:MAG: hypothetical protein AAGA02_13975 [Bacteroidota bacterium]
MVETQRYRQELNQLRIDIILHPELKHRIILKAIKTAKTRELSQLIRSYNKKNML